MYFGKSRTACFRSSRKFCALFRVVYCKGHEKDPKYFDVAFLRVWVSFLMISLGYLRTYRFSIEFSRWMINLQFCYLRFVSLVPSLWASYMYYYYVLWFIGPIIWCVSVAPVFFTFEFGKIKLALWKPNSGLHAGISDSWILQMNCIWSILAIKFEISWVQEISLIFLKKNIAHTSRQRACMFAMHVTCRTILIRKIHF